MPAIPVDFSLLDQLKRGSVQASLEIPEMPSLPSGDAVVDFFRRLYEAMVQFSMQAANDATQFAKEHPEECKTVAIVVFAVVAAVLIWVLFPVLLSIIGTIGDCVYSFVKCVFALGDNFLQVVHLLLTRLEACILSCAGFTRRGVRSGSAAARIQRAAYGGSTTGVFSKFQSHGATGR
ncbi:hypothetical protein BD309DRAFT_965640 [Dichomitus squalens]|nr:hypothetical protein BD309DRAFT_965640 [Dichomitus squalens]